MLINKLNLRNQPALKAFEAEITAQRAAEPLPPGRLSYRHYRAIHRHLFQDVYVWAGSIRTVRISKDGSSFCYPEHIDKQMRLLLAGLRQRKFFAGLTKQTFATRAAHFLEELNAIHPFREGNGRTQLSFVFSQDLADRAAHPLELERLSPPAILQATIKSFRGDERPLARLILHLAGGRATLPPWRP